MASGHLTWARFFKNKINAKIIKGIAWPHINKGNSESSGGHI